MADSAPGHDDRSSQSKHIFLKVMRQGRQPRAGASSAYPIQYDYHGIVFGMAAGRCEGVARQRDGSTLCGQAVL